MAAYDGSIRINTKISIKSAEVQLSALENRMIKTADKIGILREKMNALRNTQVPTQEYAALDQQLAKLGAEYDSLSEKQVRFLSTGGKENSTAYKRMEYDLDMIDQKQDRVISKMRELEAAGKAFTLGSSTQDFAQMEQQLRDMESDLGLMNQQHEILNLRREAAVQKAEAEREKLTAQAEEERRLAQIKENAVVEDQELIDLLERRRELTERIRDLERANAGEGYLEYNNARQELSQIEEQIAAHRREREAVEETQSAHERFGAAAKAVLNRLISLSQKLAAITSKVVAGSFKAFGKVAVKTMSSVASGMLRLTSSMIGLGKSTKRTNNIFSGGLKNILKYGLGIRSLYALVNRLRTAIKEGFGNLYNEFDSFKKSVDGLKASALTLKNAFAAAFRPLVELAIPYIQKVVEHITRLMDIIGQFMAAITGQRTYTRAIKQTTAAMKDNAKATEEAKEAAEGYLSPLDEINKYQTSKKTDSDFGTDAEGASGPMFEEVPVSDRFKNIVQWLKDMWEKANFYELGELLGEKLKNALERIPWEKIKETARKIGKSIASLINGFIEVEDLGKTIGHTLAEKINTGYEFLNAFVHELHWDSIGKFIADSISEFLNGIDWGLIYDTFVTGAKGLGDAVNSFVSNLDWEAISTSLSSFVNTLVDTIYTLIVTVDWKELGAKFGKTVSDAWKGVDWSKAGETVGEAFKAFFDFISQTIENIDWYMVGKTVKDFLVGIDWAGVVESFFEAIGAALGGLGAFLGGLIVDAIEKTKEYFRGKIEEMGGDIGGGILFGIADALADIGKWIKDHIFQPFIDGFKSAFGIASPSKVMEEMGTYIIEGLLNGICSLVGSVTQIWENMKETALRKWGEVKQNLSDTWENIKTSAGEKWASISEKISDKISEVKDNVKDVMSRIKENWSDSWENMKDGVKAAMNRVKDTVKSAAEWISDKIKSLMEKMSNLNKKASGLSKSSSRSSGSKNTSSRVRSLSLDYGPVLSSSIPKAFASLADKEFPGYATGTVIPRTMQKHLAWLGDNSQETEVVSPISTIEDALENTAARLGLAGGNGNTYRFVAQLNGRTLFEETIRQARMQQMATGRNPFALE